MRLSIKAEILQVRSNKYLEACVHLLLNNSWVPNYIADTELGNENE